MKNTKAKDLMSEDIVFISPNATLREAGEKMRDVDCGILPVGTEDRIAGIITDRDIVIRAVARGKDVSKEQVRDYMTRDAFSCHENDTLEEVADKMRTHQVSRLLVMDKAERTTGILSFGGILRKDENADEVARVVRHALRSRAA